MALGEYVLDLLEVPARMEVAKHVLACEVCTLELSETRTLLARDLVVPAPGAWGELRRVVGTLLAPLAQSTYSAVRGSAASSGASYQAGQITIVIGDMRGSRPGTVSIDGLVVHASARADVLVNREVTLFSAPAHRQVHATRTDDLGSFAFDDVVAGTFTLELALAEEVVVLEDVHVGT